MFLRSRKGALIVFVALIAIVVFIAGGIWQTRRAAIATRIEKLAQELLIANDSTRIEISGVSGNPLGSPTLHGVSLSVRDGKDWKSFFVARKIKLRYRVSDLARRKYVLESVEIEKPIFSLTKGSGGKYLLPHFGSGKKGKSTEFKINSLVVDNGRLTTGRRGEKELFNEVFVRTSLTSGKNGLALNELELSFVATTLKYRVESCKGGLSFHGDRMWADSLDVRTGESRYSLDGYVGLGDSRDVDVVALIDTLSIGELRDTKRLSFLPEQGRLAGRARVLKKGSGPTEITSSLTGTYGTHRIESLEAVTTVRKNRWENQFHLESAGSMVEGTFNVGPGASQECALDFMRFDPGVWPEIFGQTVMPAGSLNGAFRFSGNSLTSTDRNGDVQVVLDGGTYAGVSFVEGKADGNFDGEGRLVFSSLRFRGTGYEVSASGGIGPKGEIDFGFSASVSKLGEFAHLDDKFDIDSEMTATGRLLGIDGRLTVNTDVVGGLTRTSPATVSGVIKKARVEGEVWPLLSLDANVFMSPGEIRGLRVDSLSVETHIERVQGAVRPAGGGDEAGCSPLVVVVNGTVRAVRGDTVVAATAVIDCCKDGVDISLGRLSAETSGLAWKNRRIVRLGWRAGTLRILDLALSSGRSEVELSGVFEPARKRASAKLSVASLDVKTVFGRLLPVAGKLDADLTFERGEAGSSLDGLVDWSDAVLAGKAFDRLFLSASVKNKEVDVKSLEISKAQGRIAVSGALELPFDAEEFVDSLRSRRSVPTGVQARLDVATANLSLSEFSEWHPGLASLGGIADARLRIEGPLENPRATINLDAKNLRVRQYQVSGVKLEATLANHVCSISRLSLTEKNAGGEVSGFFPMEFDLGKGRLSFPDGAIGLSVKLSESDLSVVSLFVKQIASASGLVKGEAQINGTLKNPTLRGEFEITNSNLRLAGREEVLENFNAQVTLNEKVIELVKFTATQGEDGRLEGSGRIMLSQGERGRYSFDVKGKRMTFGDPEDIALKFDCDLVIYAVDVRDGGTCPKITGRIDVKQGIIAREFQTAQGPQMEQRWLCDVEVEVPNNLWLKNINAEIELGGSVTARKDEAGLVLLGSLRILRGKYYVFDNEFRITSGALEFKDVGQIDPEMNIQAETSTSGRRVFLTLGGKLSEPNIALSSEDPNLSQTDILRLLTVGKYAAAEPGQTGDSGLVPGMTGSVGNYFFRQVERRLARELKWVDSIELGSGVEGTGSLGELRWGLGKYITPELYLRYSQGLTRTSGRDVSVEYRLSDLLFLRGGVVGKDRFTGRERDEYNLDLRLKYEY